MSDDDDPSTPENYYGYTFDGEDKLCESSICQEEEATASPNNKKPELKEEQQQYFCNNERTQHTTKKKKKKKKKHHQHSLEHLSRRITEIMEILDQQGIAIPLPDSTSHKTWSNRNYGGDKKRQRKQAEREFLVARIHQLEMCCPPTEDQQDDDDDDSNDTIDDYNN